MLERIEVGIDAVELERLSEFWAMALDYTVGDLDSAGVDLDLIPPRPDLPVVFLQRVSRTRSTKNRVHLDLYATNPSEFVARLVEHGAAAVGEPQTGSEGGWWQVLADPEGNELCVCDAG